MGLNGIYPVNMYPYNIQIKRKQPVNKVNPDAEQKQQPQDNADLNRPKTSPHSVENPAGTVNISRIVVDFKNTLKAIDASKEVNEEVNAYLNLVEFQSVKENPSQKIIKSNLNNAAAILDEYISVTLNKPSRVVKDWIDALLLQKIDYKSTKSPEEVKNLPVQHSEQIKESARQANFSPKPKNEAVINQTPNISSPRPEDTKLEELYTKAGNITDKGDYEKALTVYDKLLPVSQKINNKSIESKIYFDKAYIYDVNGDYQTALEFYNKAANIAFTAGDWKNQAQAHYNMASIYDDFGKIDAALDHYYKSIALDGQVENLKGQTLALNEVGNIYSGEKNYKQALDHFQAGFALTGETNDKEGRACILSNTAGVFRDLGKDARALKYYRESVKLDSALGNIEGYAKTYEQIGDIMLRNNQAPKAVTFYNKSLLASRKAGDSAWSNRIMEKLRQNSLAY